MQGQQTPSAITAWQLAIAAHELPPLAIIVTISRMMRCSMWPSQCRAAATLLPTAFRASGNFVQIA